VSLASQRMQQCLPSLVLVAFFTAAAAGEKLAMCRVFSSRYSDPDFEGGYDYKQDLTELVYERDLHAPQLPHAPSGCDLQSFSHAELNRSFVLNASRPFLIRGATDGWPARTKWGAQNITDEYGGDVFSVGPDGEETLGEVIAREGAYHTGQMNHEHDCYADGFDLPACAQGATSSDARCEGVAKQFERKYSPLLAAAAADHDIPSYLLPLRALQLGIGRGRTIGVRPEEHPSAWWANIKGTKRWLLHPPDASEQEVELLTDTPRSCAVSSRYTNTLFCDQQEGDILWVPAGWLHETCALDSYSVGLGGISFEGADRPQGAPEHACATIKLPTGKTHREYRLTVVPYCKAHPCPSLPTRELK